jgi:two-component system, NarL family, nitrate/nitrite response regulator NarL
MSTITVAFVDDHPVLLEGICAVFARRGRFNVVARGDSAEAAIEIVEAHKPDLLFVDLSMRGDIYAAIKQITAGNGKTKVMVYTASTGVDHALKALDSGASAFVVKDSISDELFGAVDAVLRGEIFVSHAYAGRVLSGLRNRSARASSTQAANLSQREQEVVGQLLLARSNKEIAIKMSISEKTVKHYMTNLMAKLNARNRVEVALAAQQLDNRI